MNDWGNRGSQMHMSMFQGLAGLLSALEMLSSFGMRVMCQKTPQQESCNQRESAETACCCQQRGSGLNIVFFPDDSSAGKRCSHLCDSRAAS